MASTKTGFRESQYFSGQGVLFLSPRTVGGAPEGLVPVGNVAALTISLETTEFEHKESQTGARSIDLTLVQELNATMTATMESLDRDNLALAMFGTGASVAAASVSDEQHVAKLGTWIQLANINIDPGTIVVGDDATPTTTYVLGDNYEIDEENGMIYIMTAAEQTAASAANPIDDDDPIFVDYDFLAHDRVDAFATSSGAIRWATFAGLNTVDGNNPVRITAYRTQVQPLAELALITEELAGMEVSLQIQQDSLRPAGQQFYEVKQLQGRFTSPVTS